MSEQKYLGWCPQLAERFKMECDCCISCHEDDNGEYAFLGQIEFEDGYYDCCCKMKEIINK